MKNVLGNNITLTLFGESHGECIGGVIDGLPPGLPIDREYINAQMELRRPYGAISTGRHEADEVQFVSGVKDGLCEGTPVCLLIRNSDVHSKDYDNTLARPSHADYTAQLKYEGYQDSRGGGHFSGRLTAVIVASGAIVRKALEEKGIFIGSHIAQLHGISDGELDGSIEQLEKLNKKLFATISVKAEEAMKAEIEKAAAESNSLGGILETEILGLPGGLGEPAFDSLESLLAHAIFSIPAVKGISFGAGFELADMKGSEANDQMRIIDGKAVTLTNHSGGINGGISNGMPVVFRTVFKPTASIGKKQQTIDYIKMTDEEIEVSGRHDPVIIHRARAVVDNLTALVLADVISQRYGYMWLRSE